MRIDVLTLFPEMFAGPFDASIVGRAREQGLVEIRIVNTRDFSTERQRIVDDYSYGGGSGMVMKAAPIFAAVEAMRCPEECRERVVLMTPQGARLDQAKAAELARYEHLVIVCGHYEGVDERVREHLVDEEISIGDYVLTGGELPAMVVMDAVIRLLPGALGAEDGAVTDSFASGLLEQPQYTRPAEFRGWKVPDVLLSGNHEVIRVWRREQALKRTLERRPDLLERAALSEEDRGLLEKIRGQRDE
ncbi:MAG: tRNA (guanosine(37)-N1)-methyltransferase TrmD [Armatimonadota bacterium]|nr:MAG: tRNA (guanosine(37)-N1)-methyltransferase TrmD [Armatimonadota bacterium]